MTKKRLKLKSLEISGYKSISSTEPLTLELGDATILLGANGAGKSNIISFFRMLGFMMSGAFQRFVALSGTNQVFLHFGTKKTSSINGKLKMSYGEDEDNYSFTLTPAAGGRLIISDEKITWTKIGNTKPFEKIITGNFLESGLPQINDSTAKTIKRLLSQCKAYQFHDSSTNGPLRQASLVGAAQYLQAEGNNLASFLFFLKGNYPNEYNRIVSYIRTVMPQFGDFYLEPVNNYVSLSWTDSLDNDYVFTADQFSDGTVRFIALATLLLQPENTMPSVIIIDEPELGLHPFAIDQLIEMIKDASLHSQVIIATQSPLLIDGFSADCITVLEQNNIHHNTTAKHLDEKNLKVWLNDYTLGELWQKNIIGGLPL